MNNWLELEFVNRFSEITISLDLLTLSKAAAIDLDFRLFPEDLSLYATESCLESFANVLSLESMYPGVPLGLFLESKITFSNI